MKRITFVVILAIVAFGALAIRYSRGRVVKSTGENRTTTSRDGTIIAFTKRGSGPPLIIVDGAFCYRENGPATELATQLAQHFTVFTYDRRGRGESGDTAPIRSSVKSTISGPWQARRKKLPMSWASLPVERSSCRPWRAGLA